MPHSPLSPAVPAIALSHVRFRYDGVTIFQDVSFSVQSGEYLGIIGPNGSGKTTLLKIMLGLLKPDSGSVKIFGRDVFEHEARKQIGYVPQRIAQSDFSFPATVQEVVESGRTALLGFGRRMKQADYDAVDRAIAVTNIDDLRGKRIDQLSGGQRQRAFVARALAAEPKILILDEPTVGVDLESQDSFYAFLRTLNEEQGMTIVFVSHDTHALMNAVKCVLCLQEGDVCACNLDDLLRPDHMQKHFEPGHPHLPHNHGHSSPAHTHA